MHLVLDSSLEQICKYLEDIVSTSQLGISNRCKALKALLSLGLARGSLPNLLTGVHLICTNQITNGIEHELRLLSEEEAMTELSFFSNESSLCREKIYYMPKEVDQKKE